MGRLVEQLAPEQGIEVVGRVDEGRDEWAPADVAIDFSTADALRAQLPALPRAAAAGRHRHDRLVGARARACAQQAERAGLGVVASANFSIGVNIFQLVVAEAARLMQPQPQYGAWIHESASRRQARRAVGHGAAAARRDDRRRVTAAPIDMSSTRAGTIPGTHTVGFDGPSDTIELTHTARDRRGFASGALVAARWIQGRPRLVHHAGRPAGRSTR